MSLFLDYLTLSWTIHHIQGGTLRGVTNFTNANGIYESSAISAKYAITCQPLTILLTAKDYTGAGLQEAAFESSRSNTDFSYFVAARYNGATITGDYLIIGRP